MLISELGRNTKYFLSLDTVYVKTWICFVAFFSSSFHFKAMKISTLLPLKEFWYNLRKISQNFA